MTLKSHDSVQPQSRRMLSPLIIKTELMHSVSVQWPYSEKNRTSLHSRDCSASSMAEGVEGFTSSE